MPDRTFTVETPLKAFPVNFCFNQFSVEEAIDISREATLDYLGRTGELLPMEHFIVPPEPKIVPDNVIVMTYRGDMGEVLLSNFPFRRMVLDSRETTFEADPVALLRSPLNVQRNLIRALYVPTT